jgi:hypothetical protein
MPLDDFTLNYGLALSTSACREGLGTSNSSHFIVWSLAFVCADGSKVL